MIPLYLKPWNTRFHGFQNVAGAQSPEAGNPLNRTWTSLSLEIILDTLLFTSFLILAFSGP